jgi:hypothetical protein
MSSTIGKHHGRDNMSIAERASRLFAQKLN